MRSLVVVALLLGACASAPKPGPCVTLECGVVCCNNDGKRCPGCPEEAAAVLETSPGSWDSMPGIIMPTYSFDAGVDTGCYWVDGVAHLVIEGDVVEDDMGICLVLE